MSWLDKTNIEIPAIYGVVTPYPHWVSSTEVVLIFVSRSLTYPGQIWAWPCAVNTLGTLTHNPADIHKVGDTRGPGEIISWVEALLGGGYVVHTITPGSG